MTGLLSKEELAAIRSSMEAANVSVDRPWELYCAHDEAPILQNHTFFGGHSDEDYGPCRITTGPEFDEHVAAEYAEVAANAVPRLLAHLDAITAAVREVVASLTPTYYPDYPGDHGFSEETGAILRELLRKD